MKTSKKKRTRSPAATPVAGVAVDGRDRILAAAIKSFAERGFAGTTTAAVAREARVTQPLVHHHFRSKEGLWRAAVDHLFAEIPLLFTLDEPQRRDVEVAFPILAQFVRLSAARPEIGRIIAREGAVASPRLSYLVERHLGQVFGYFVSRLRDAQKAAVLAKEIRPELLLMVIIGASTHIFEVPALAKQVLGIDVGARDTREALTRALQRLVSRGVLADG